MGQSRPVFSDELVRRFPELVDSVFDGDEELPYLMARHLVDWLSVVAAPRLDQEVVRRVVEFHQWCQEQPSGASAEDDILTIEAVGFIEDLFEHDELLPLIPRLFRKEELRRSRDYWIAWVGKDRYDAALRQRFDAK